MKNRVFTFTLFVCCGIFASMLSAQTSQTYALVIGVSKFADPNIKHLKYADDDALLFENLLLSDAFKLNKQNIKVFINDSASLKNIHDGLSWMLHTSKTGDRVFFFYSGHGNAISSESYHLFPFDAKTEQDDPLGSSNLDMLLVKALIKTMVSKGVHPVLIVDAPSIGAKYLQNDILEKMSGEMQFISCIPNQDSFEDVKWGNGHGVFTYYLTKGAMGFADEDKNLSITFGELANYVKKHVRSETYDMSSRITKQIPTFCCTDKEDLEFAKVDTALYNQLLRQEDQLLITPEK